MQHKLRNIAIIAHVDHGKTTLIDKLIEQSDTFDERFQVTDRMMDSNDLEKERGITIFSKNTTIKWKDYIINIIDTPGHADFGGEVERVLSMVDSVLLIVDSVDGTMPQTRFVTKKAFAKNLNPIVVINKIDKSDSRPDWVIDQVFDLFYSLGGNEKQLDFKVVYASATKGYAYCDENIKKSNMEELFETIVKNVPEPNVEINGAFQMQVASLNYSNFIGIIAIGRISRGQAKKGMQISVIKADGNKINTKISHLLGFKGLEKKEIDQAIAGDIVGVAGIEDISISDTICDPKKIEAIPAITVEEPTVSMIFKVNDSPFAGLDGKYITSRSIRDRLHKEIIHNVSLRVEDARDPSEFVVSGRGELHLSILIETMRREGFEIALGRPQVILRTINNVICEPFEELTIDVESNHQGAVIDKLSERKANILNITPNKDRVKLEFIIPSRGLIGFRTEFLTTTNGTGVMYSAFDSYKPKIQGQIAQRKNGSLISMNNGKSVSYAIFNLQKSGKFFIGPGEDIYEGMIVGVNNRENDLSINLTKGKQLTNIRASGTDEAVILVPAINLDLEKALEFINDDELLEVTPKKIRIRKKILQENQRKKSRKKI